MRCRPSVRLPQTWFFSSRLKKESRRRESRRSLFLFSSRSALRDGIDFNQTAFWQRRDANRRSRRSRGVEEFAVNSVHFGEIRHVRDEDGRLDNLGKVRTAGFQNLAHVRQRLSRFCFDATFDDFHGFRDERDAAARVEEAARLGKREMKRVKRVSKKERRKKPINPRARKRESA